MLLTRLLGFVDAQPAISKMRHGMEKVGKVWASSNSTGTPGVTQSWLALVLTKVAIMTAMEAEIIIQSDEAFVLGTRVTAPAA